MTKQTETRPVELTDKQIDAVAGGAVAQIHIGNGFKLQFSNGESFKNGAIQFHAHINL